MQELTRIRNERGLSQQKLSDAAGVNKATINQIERGRRSPNALGVEIGDFFPKAQMSLPDFAGQRRGAEELEEGPHYNALEAVGRVLAMRWRDSLVTWDAKIPEGETPDSFDSGRLLQWALEIAGTRSVYAAIVREPDVPQREQLEDTLRMMEEAERAAVGKVKRVFEPAKTLAEFREIVMAFEESARDTAPTGPSRRVHFSGESSWAEIASDAFRQAMDPTEAEAPTKGA
jgi:DNA-binding XRE family transcriptional regulator